MSAEAPASPFIHRIGQLTRARGLDGEIQIRLFRARPEEVAGKRRRPKTPQPVELEWPDGRTQPAQIQSVKFVDPTRVLVRFDAVDDREGAEALEGAFLDVDPRRAPEGLCDALDRLFGAEVVDADAGEVLGRVDELRDTGAHPLLVLGALMIPFVDAFVVEASPGRVVVRLPDGLREINAP